MHTTLCCCSIAALLILIIVSPMGKCVDSGVSGAALAASGEEMKKGDDPPATHTPPSIDTLWTTAMPAPSRDDSTAALASEALAKLVERTRTSAPDRRRLRELGASRHLSSRLDEKFKLALDGVAVVGDDSESLALVQLVENIAMDEAGAGELLAHRVLDVVASSIRSSSFDPDAMRFPRLKAALARVLWRLASHNSRHRALVRDSGVIPALLQVVKSRVEHNKEAVDDVVLALQTIGSP